MDYAREWTDERLEELERKMRAEYAQAAREMEAKLKKSLAKFEREREAREKAMDDTAEARAAHKAWLESQAANQAWMGEMVGNLTDSAVRADQMARNAINDALPRIYSENANMAAYAVDSAIGMDTSFTLVNEDAVRYLMGLGGDDALIHEFVYGPAELGVQTLRLDMDRVKDWNWNRQKFTSAITQGVLQGESIPNIAKRVQSVTNMDMRAATMAARTATTAAENMGRFNSYSRASRLGIDMESEWQATLDERTRESHRAMDGERVPEGEPFPNGCMYPGDPHAEPAETYNCRCRLRGRVVGFDGVRGEWADDAPGERWARLPEGMTYQEWKAAKPVSRAESYENKATRVSGDWYANGAAGGVTAPQGAIALDASAQVWQAAGTEAFDYADRLISRADPLTAEVWKKYEPDVRFHKVDGKSGFYRPGEGVTMNIARDLSDKNSRGKMSTFFHEFGHNIDGLAGGGKWKWYSRDAKFAETISEEVGEHVNALHKELKAAHSAAVKALDKGDFEPAIDWLESNTRLSHLPGMYREALDHLGDKAWFEMEGYPPWMVETKADQIAFLKADIKDKLASTKPLKSKAYATIEDEIMGMTTAEKFSLSDIYEGATKCKVEAGWGHGKSYWTKHGDYLSLEAFAEFYSAECVYAETPQTLDTLRRFLPRSYERYREILKEVLEA